MNYDNTKYAWSTFSPSEVRVWIYTVYLYILQPIFVSVIVKQNKINLDSFLPGQVCGKRLFVAEQIVQNDIHCVCAREAVVIVTHPVAAALQFHPALHMTNQFIPYLCGSERGCSKETFQFVHYYDRSVHNFI